jgi:hypothetical protein
MLESVRQYLQDWSDACEYAKECWPDVSAVTPHEPWSALLTIAAGCFLAWAINERRLAKMAARAASAAKPAPHQGLNVVLDQMKPGASAGASEKKLAA